MNYNRRITLVIIAMLGLNLASLMVESTNNVATNLIRLFSDNGTLYAQARKNALLAESALIASEKAVNTLQGEIVGLNTAAEGQAAEAIELSDQITKLQTEATDLTAQAAEQKAEAAEAQAAASTEWADQVTNLNAEVAILTAQVAEQQTEIAELSKPITVRLAGDTMTVTQAVLTTSQRINARAVDAVSRNIGSITAKGIPFAGVHAVVGATQMNIRNLCETVIDLNALNLALTPDGQPDADATTICETKVPGHDEIWDLVKSDPRAAWDSAKNAMPDVDWPEYDLPEVLEWAISSF